MTQQHMPSARLTMASLAALRDGVDRPSYDREALQIGVVHLGPGAFFRAHQMDVYDRLVAQDQRWGVCAVALNSWGVREALAPQDGLYTLAELGEPPNLRVIGALRELLVAGDDAALVLQRLAAPTTRLVGLTVTEKGYHLDGRGVLSPDDADIRADLADLGYPKTAIGWLVAGLRARRDAGLEPFVVLSCDNLSGNGAKLKQAVIAFALAGGEGNLARWIEAKALFPSTMVDSITPATDDALRARVAEAIGLEDAWPIQREAFTQWVVEDLGAPILGELASAGVTLTADVAGFEQAKLRLLNGAHSSLAYLGRLAGIETVSDAMAEPRLARFIETLMRDDLAASLTPPEGMDVGAYIDAVLARFRNPAIRHRLSQIAWDGSQKLPVRLFGAVASALEAKSSIERLAVPVAAWMRFVVTTAQAGEALTDPLADRMLEIGRAATGEADRDVAAFLGLDVFAQGPCRSAPFVQALAVAYARLTAPDPLAALS